ncbi:diphthine--ammonia ligase [Thermogladius sp. 4427co]|uniref:diphthine--ammonia ligase n=1 Tax=Thermogladius sp. 4427co TaxID=3450718 RepID=UPI003F78D652
MSVVEIPTATVLYSGGKDSTVALMKALSKGFKIPVLTSVIPLYDYSMLYHKPNFTALSLQSFSIGIPLESVSVGRPGLEEAVLENVLRRVKERYGVEYVITGGILSRFQKRVFDKIASRVGLQTYTPLWGLNQEDYLREVLRAGIKFTIISITAMGIPHRYLGRVVDESDIEELIKLSRKYGFNPSFEGGEAETLVVDAPIFKYRLRIYGNPRIISDFVSYFDIRKIVLERK